ncbi:MAG: hypothetical protein WAS27_02675 [Candidatus Saccharimonadales bacterium]
MGFKRHPKSRYAVRGPDCYCDECKRAYRQDDSFTRDLPNGTTIYGPKSTEGRPGYRHGHRGESFDCSPHSTIGSAVVGDAHTYNEHRDRRTKRQ